MKSVHPKVGAEWLNGLHRLGGDFKFPEPAALNPKRARYAAEHTPLPAAVHVNKGYGRDRHGAIRRLPA